MGFKVAFGSSDGKVVNKHFGRCEQFYIIEIENSTFRFVETRQAQPPCIDGVHKDGVLQSAAENLNDCRFVIVSKIGPSAQAALFQNQIEVIEYNSFIEEAAKLLISEYS